MAFGLSMLNKSITAKLILTSVAGVFAVEAAFGIFSYFAEKSRLEALNERKAIQFNERLLSTLKMPMYHFDLGQIGAVLALEMKEDDVSSIVIKDENGAFFAGKTRDGRDEIKELTSQGMGVVNSVQCYRKLNGTIQADVDGAQVPVGSVEVCITDATLKKSLHSLVVTMAAQTVAVALVLCLCFFVILRFVLLKPILVIRRALGRFAAKDFSSRSSLQSSDELGDLGKHFNSMAETIQNYSENLEKTVEERTCELVRKNEIILQEKEVSEAATQAKTQLLIEQLALIKKLEDAQGQLLQSEKMASVGQLAAGVAHEINNPIGFIKSNLGSLKEQVSSLLSLIAVFERAETALSGHSDLLEAIQQAKQDADLAFLKVDIQSLIDESLEGVGRVKKIVDNLKDFSRVNTAEWQPANLENGLESTLNIVWNELKYKAEVKKEYAGLPEIECIASQLNQVFMNLMINASHAIENRGVITLRTGFDDDEVWVEVQDTGHGIKPEHIERVFEPFFTTKPVGKGTGLGLSLAYGIVKRHHGRLEVRSEVGTGTVFRVVLPRERVIDEVDA